MKGGQILDRIGGTTIQESDQKEDSYNQSENSVKQDQQDQSIECHAMDTD